MMIGSTPSYEERYVAFIDILGFSALVERAATDPSLLQRIVSLLEEVKQFAKIGESMDKTDTGPDQFFLNMFRMSTFSDSIAISTKPNPIGLHLLLMISGIICVRLLHDGIFTRGGIIKEKLIHTNDLIIGEGLISAYKLESAAAIYPRVLLSNQVSNDIENLAKQNGLNDYRRQDFDGLWHLHILHPLFMNMGRPSSTPPIAKEQTEFISTGRNEVAAALLQNTNPGVLAKLGWLARYINEYAHEFSIEPIPLK